MICKYCQSKLEDYGVCPVCGTENPAPTQVLADEIEATETIEAVEAPAKKSKLGLIACIAIGAVVLLAAGTLLLGWKCFGWFEKSDSFGVTLEESAKPTDGFGASALSERMIYAVENAVPGSKEMTAPVVRVAGEEISNAEFNVYFWMEYYNFMNQYGAYASYLGLDSTKPLYEQESITPIDPDKDDSGMMTWEQHFVNAAIESIKLQKSLALAAKEAGYQLSEELQAQLEQMPDDLAQAAAEENESIDAFVAKLFGSGVTLQDYYNYTATYLTASGYYSEYLAEQVQPSDAEIEAYFDENAESFQGLRKLNDIAVRHVLVMPEKDTDADGDGTPEASSEEAWAAAKQKADELYQSWLEGEATEDSFAALAAEVSEDPGSAQNGGLYDRVYPGRMLPEFDAWCFDEPREYGDNGMVKTDYGYHLMYFVETLEQRTWFEQASDALTGQKLSELAEDEIAPYTDLFEIDFRSISICDLIAANAAAEEDSEQEQLP